MARPAETSTAAPEGAWQEQRWATSGESVTYLLGMLDFPPEWQLDHGWAVPHNKHASRVPRGSSVVIQQSIAIKGSVTGSAVTGGKTPVQISVTTVPVATLPENNGSGYPQLS